MRKVLIYNINRNELLILYLVAFDGIWHGYEDSRYQKLNMLISDRMKIWSFKIRDVIQIAGCVVPQIIKMALLNHEQISSTEVINIDQKHSHQCLSTSIDETIAVQKVWAQIRNY